MRGPKAPDSFIAISVKKSSTSDDHGVAAASGGYRARDCLARGGHLNKVMVEQFGKRRPEYSDGPVKRMTSEGCADAVHASVGSLAIPDAVRIIPAVKQSIGRASS
jgi:hypothetical protein